MQEAKEQRAHTPKTILYLVRMHVIQTLLVGLVVNDLGLYWNFVSITLNLIR